MKARKPTAIETAIEDTHKNREDNGCPRTKKGLIWLRSAGVEHICVMINPTHVASQKVAENFGLSRTLLMLDGEEVWDLWL